MRWEMEMEEIEVVLEKIWDLHDKISDAIHAITRAHFLKSIRSPGGGSRTSDVKKYPTMGCGGGGGGGGGEDGKGGFVFVKGFKVGEEDDTAIADARSLNGIRTALENLEDQLEFFHTVQSQQRAERDAAIARLEQSRIILAMRLADHHGKKYKVIEEALEFVGDVHDTGRFVSPENLFGSQSGDNLEIHEGKRSRSSVLTEMLISSVTLAKKSLKLERIGGVLGNAALFAVSVLALLQLHQASFKSDFVFEAPPTQESNFHRDRDENSNSHSNQVKSLDVLSARG